MRSSRAGFHVKVRNISSTGAVDVFVNLNLVGSITLDASGDGELLLDTQHGDHVPALQTGDEIEVVDADDDATLILIGDLG
jgi:hypothetical protein